MQPRESVILVIQRSPTPKQWMVMIRAVRIDLPKHAAVFQESESDPSKSMIYPGSNNPIQQLKAREKDVEDNLRGI